VYVLLEFWQKNHYDPYYEPTIVVHDKMFAASLGDKKVALLSLK